MGHAHLLDQPLAVLTAEARRVRDEATGTRVTWTWVGNNPHNVTADGFASETQVEGKFIQTFDRAGSYAYACTIHPGMEGTVVVTDDESGDAT